MKAFRLSMGGIGSVMGLLLVYGAVYLIFHRTPATDEEVNLYIQNSEVVELTDITFYDEEEMVRYARIPWRRNHSSRYKDIVKLQSPDSKKCFVLESYGAPFSISIDTNSLCRSPKVYIVVNKDDMNNPKLGSKENPVVVLWWYTDSNYKFYEVSEKDYKNGVKEYLTYCQNG